MKHGWVATGQANSTFAGLIAGHHYIIMFKIKTLKIIKQSRDTDDVIGFVLMSVGLLVVWRNGPE